MCFVFLSLGFFFGLDKRKIKREKEIEKERERARKRIGVLLSKEQVFDFFSTSCLKKSKFKALYEKRQKMKMKIPSSGVRRYELLPGGA